MSAMGRACADYEEKLLLKVDAAEEMFDALRSIRRAIIFAPDKSALGKAILATCNSAIAKAEGR
jgi:hypothetical protein